MWAPGKNPGESDEPRRSAQAGGGAAAGPSGAPKEKKQSKGGRQVRCSLARCHSAFPLSCARCAFLSQGARLDATALLLQLEMLARAAAAADEAEKGAMAKSGSGGGKAKGGESEEEKEEEGDEDGGDAEPTRQRGRGYSESWNKAPLAQRFGKFRRAAAGGAACSSPGRTGLAGAPPVSHIPLSRARAVATPAGPRSEEEKNAIVEAVRVYAEEHDLSRDDLSWLVATKKARRRKASPLITVCPSFGDRNRPAEAPALPLPLPSQGTDGGGAGASRGSKAWLEIAAAAPHRSPKQVFAWGARHFHPDSRKGRWSEEEDEQLKKCDEPLGGEAAGADTAVAPVLAVLSWVRACLLSAQARGGEGATVDGDRQGDREDAPDLCRQVCSGEELPRAAPPHSPPSLRC